MTQESFRIEGLAGAKTLTGEIPVKGAKNDVLKIIAASFLFTDEVVIENAPDIADVRSLLELTKSLGAEVAHEGDTIRITPPATGDGVLDRTLAKRLRSSVVLTGPVLARYGQVSFPYPGGCVIGTRPIDLFVRAFTKMGATYTEEDETFHLSAKKLTGADIFLDVPSVGVTETLMMAGTLAKGTTVIRNAAMEPEIQNLAHYLVSCGAVISGIGTPTLTIEGGEPLQSTGSYTVIPDRIETGSFLILAALAGKDVTVTKCNPLHVRSLLNLLETAGVSFKTTDTTIQVTDSGKPYKAVNVKTHEYPGFATDLQAPMTVFLTQAEGESLVFETMFEGRLNYTEDLVHMGADITMFDPHRVMVRGPRALSGRELQGPDLRAGLAYVIAGIIAKKTSIIRNIGHIDRGYERIEERFRALGVSISRESV